MPPAYSTDHHQIRSFNLTTFGPASTTAGNLETSQLFQLSDSNQSTAIPNLPRKKLKEIQKLLGSKPECKQTKKFNEKIAKAQKELMN